MADCYRVGRDAYEQGAGALIGQQPHGDDQPDSEDWLSELSELSEVVEGLMDFHDLDGGLEPGTPPAEADDEGPELELVV
jgi:hypothetical protein